MMRPPPRSTLFPYTTLSRSDREPEARWRAAKAASSPPREPVIGVGRTGAAGSSLASTALTAPARSEEHTSELQSRQYIVCRLLLEKKTCNRIDNSDLATPVF